MLLVSAITLCLACLVCHHRLALPLTDSACMFFAYREPCKKPGACPSVPGGPECYKIEQAVNSDVHVVFDTSPGECFRVIDMLGADSAVPSVCASAGGALSLALPTHGTTSGPLYLLPINTM